MNDYKMDVQIKIRDPILRCYLAALFEERDSGYLASITTLTGAAICSLVKESPHPVKTCHHDKTLVKFHLPRSKCNNELRGRFLYIHPDSEIKINATLKKEFDVNFLTYCTEMRIQGHKLKDIIPLFIYENKLDVFDGDIETLKKRYYRREVELLSKLSETLRQKAYFNTRKVCK